MEGDFVSQENPKGWGRVFLILAIVAILIIIAIFIFYLLKSSEKVSSGIKLDLNESESEVTLEEGGKVDFVLDDGNHSLRVDSFQGNRVNFTLQSEPIEASLNLGEEGSYDLNGDGVNDITVKFNRVDNGKPVLGISEYIEVERTDDAIDVGDTSVPVVSGGGSSSGGGGGGGSSGGGGGSGGGSRGSGSSAGASDTVTDEAIVEETIQQRAVREFDETVCEELEDLIEQITCVGAVIEQKDTNNCVALQIAELKEQCYGFSALKAKDVSICDNIDDAENEDDIFEDTKDLCILDVLKLGVKSVDLCDSITSDTIKDDCVYHMVTTDEDPIISLCERLISSNLKENCVRLIAQEKKDSNICSSLTENSLITICEQNSVVSFESNFKLLEISEPVTIPTSNVVLEEIEGFGEIVKYDADETFCGLVNEPETFAPIGNLFRLPQASNDLMDAYFICVGDLGAFPRKKIPRPFLSPQNKELYKIDNYYVAFFTYVYEGEEKYGIVTHVEYVSISSDAPEDRLLGGACTGTFKGEFEGSNGGIISLGLCGDFNLGNAYFVDYDNSKEDIIIKLPNGEEHQVKMAKLISAEEELGTIGIIERLINWFKGLF